MAETHLWGRAPFAIRIEKGMTKIVTIWCRDRWALDALIAAEAKGSLTETQARILAPFIYGRVSK